MFFDKPDLLAEGNAPVQWDSDIHRRKATIIRSLTGKFVAHAFGKRKAKGIKNIMEFLIPS